MNAYYNNKREINSNNDIFKNYLLGEATPAPMWKRRSDAVLAIIMAILSILTGSTARRIVRVFSVALLLVALVGVIGAVEIGAIGLGLGFLIGSCILVLEYLCLRKH